MTRSFSHFSCLVLSLTFVFAGVVCCQDNEATVSFTDDIRPILENNCTCCHGPDEPEGDVRMDIHDDVIDYIEPGDAEISELYDVLVSEEEDEMMPPPDDGGPLGDSDIELIKTWINEGANWPEGMILQVLEDSDVDSGDTSEPPAGDTADVKVGPNIWKAIGSLHPAATHLPIGLLMAAGIFAFLSLRGNFVMSDCAYYCLWLGTLGAIAACFTGWWFGLTMYPKEPVLAFEDLWNMDHKLFWHRSAGIVMTVFALLLSLFAASARNRDPDDGVAWKMGLILLAIGIGYVGHQGGKLTWKASHYDELFEVINEYIPGVINIDGEAAEPADNQEESADESSTESTDNSESEDSANEIDDGDESSQ